MPSFFVFTAMRFALMEAKVALTKLLLQAELELAPGFEKITLASGNGLLTPENGLLLVMKLINE